VLFSFDKYMAEHWNSSGDERPTTRPTRRATRLRILNEKS